jgi:hypothetical protein
MAGFTVDGVRYATAMEAQKARRRKALEGIASNKGMRNKLWNLFARPTAKKEAKEQLESMRNGGSGVRMYE